jgi:hypothetical protein
VWISGELISLPGHPTPELTGATGLTTGAPTTGAGEHERR